MSFMNYTFCECDIVEYRSFCFRRALKTFTLWNSRDFHFKTMYLISKNSTISCVKLRGTYDKQLHVFLF